MPTPRARSAGRGTSDSLDQDDKGDIVCTREEDEGEDGVEQRDCPGQDKMGGAKMTGGKMRWERNQLVITALPALPNRKREIA